MLAASIKIPTPASVGQGIILVAGTLAALGTLYRYLWRPLRKWWVQLRGKLRAAVDVVNRELNHNGGSSMKDTVHDVREVVRDLVHNVERIEADQARLHTHLTENGDALDAVAQVIDNIVELKQEDHDRLWDAIVDMGGPDHRHRFPPKQ